MRNEHLGKELEWFNTHRADLLSKGRGKWAAVHNQQLIGIYDSFAEAYDHALESAKSTKVLVKQILDKEEPIDISINYRLGLLNAYYST